MEKVDSIAGHYSTSKIPTKSQAMRNMGRLQGKVSVKSEPMDLGMEDDLLQHSRAQHFECASAISDVPLSMQRI